MYHECIAMWACSFKCKIVRNYVEAWYWYIYIRKSTRIHAQSCTVVLCACMCQIVRLWASTWFNLVKWDIVGSSDQLDKHIACARTHTFIYIYIIWYIICTHMQKICMICTYSHIMYIFFTVPLRTWNTGQWNWLSPAASPPPKIFPILLTSRRTFCQGAGKLW